MEDFARLISERQKRLETLEQTLAAAWTEKAEIEEELEHLTAVQHMMNGKSSSPPTEDGIGDLSRVGMTDAILLILGSGTKGWWNARSIEAVAVKHLFTGGGKDRIRNLWATLERLRDQGRVRTSKRGGQRLWRVAKEDN